MSLAIHQPSQGSVSPPVTAMAEPVVSVLMPVFNGQRFLAKAIQSILDQTFSGFELIVVNDGSTDNTAQILAGFARRDGRVRVINLKHVGLSDAINAGLAAVRGEFVARVDCDDECPSNRFALELDYLRRHPEAVAVSGQVLEIDEDGDPLAFMPGLHADHEQIDQAMLQLDWSFAIAASMIRTSAFHQIGGYSKIYPHGDYDVTVRLAEIGKLANLPETMLRYRRHGDCITIRIPNREKLLIALKSACERRKIPYNEPPMKFQPVTESRRRAYSRQSRIRAWRSLRAGNLRTARKYAWRALLHCPWCGENWRLLVCAARGH